jgi:plasmid stabilization system protein ParE
MPRSAYTDKQERKAKHIEEGYEDRGVSKKVAKARAWATVNKQDAGGNRRGSGKGAGSDRERDVAKGRSKASGSKGRSSKGGKRSTGGPSKKRSGGGASKRGGSRAKR